MDIDERIRRLSSEHGGAILRADAVRAGLTPGQLRHRLATGRWLRRHRGVYLDARELESADAVRRTTLLASAATLAHPGSLASHHTAAVLHGLPLLGDGDGRVHLTKPGRPRTPSSWGDVVLHAAGRPEPPRWTARVPTTSVARTVVDLARWSSPLGGLMAADDALRRAITTPEELHRTLEAQRTWPWHARAEQVLRLASGLSESPGESFSRLFFDEQGVDQPAQQVELRAPDGRFVARVDFLWPEGVVGEFDGMTKYDEPGALRAEKLRQESIEQLGHVVVRWTWRDLAVRPGTTARRIGAARERAPARRAAS